VTAQNVCVPGYAKKVRAVPAWLKRQAYAEYGITQYKTGDYEVDHLIPLVWVNTRSGKYSQRSSQAAFWFCSMMNHA